jgi:hypothetical protein
MTPEELRDAARGTEDADEAVCRTGIREHRIGLRGRPEPKLAKELQSLVGIGGVGEKRDEAIVDPVEKCTRLTQFGESEFRQFGQRRLLASHIAHIFSVRF